MADDRIVWHTEKQMERVAVAVADKLISQFEACRSPDDIRQLVSHLRQRNAAEKAAGEPA